MEKLEIYDEDTLNEFELKRQNNIIRNYEFFKLCGKIVHYLVLLPCLLVPSARHQNITMPLIVILFI